MTGSKRVIGATAKRHGKEFEASLEQWFSLQSAQKNWIDIRKQNEALKPVRPIGKGQFLAVYTKSSGCDYFGTMMGGTSIVLEAKHRENDRISQTDLTDAEWEHLTATATLGGYAMLITEFADRRLFLFPATLLSHSQLVYKFKHIKEKDLIRDGYEITFNDSLYEKIKNNSNKAFKVLVEVRNRKEDYGLR